MARPAIKTTPPDVADPLPEERFINREQLREIIPTSDFTIARWQRECGFPAPVKLGDAGQSGRNYWWLPAIRAWTQQRAEREARSGSELGE